MKKKLLDFSKIIFFLALGIFFIWLFMHNLTAEEKTDIYRSFLSANYWWIILSVFIGVFSHYSRAVRWKLLMEPLGYKPSLKNTFMAVMIGYFANLALPRLGEVSRCGILARYEKIPMNKSFGTVVTERGIDMISLLFAFFINFILHINKLNLFKQSNLYNALSKRYDQLENPGIIYWVTAGIFIVIILLLYHSRHLISGLKIYKSFKVIILGFIEGLKSLTKLKKPYLFIFHSLNIWLMYLLMAYVVFFSIPETSKLSLDVGLAVLVFGSVGIIIVQGGIGIYPWIVAETLIIFGIEQTKGYAMGWLLWSGQTVMIITFGILSMVLLPLLNIKQHESSGI